MLADFDFFDLANDSGIELDSGVDVAISSLAISKIIDSEALLVDTSKASMGFIDKVASEITSAIFEIVLNP